MDTFQFMQLQKKEQLDKKDIIALNPSIENEKAFISNDLIKAMFHRKGSYSAIQLIFYIASRDNSNTVKKGDYYHIRLDLNDFLKKYGSTKSSLYRHLDSIQKTVVTFYDSKDKTLWEKISLISRQEKLTRNIIEIDMHEKIYSKIKETTNFTVFNVSNFQTVFSYNTYRVLILLGMISSQTTPRKEFTLDELNFLFDTNYKNLYEFDRQIFKKAKIELDDNSNLTFESERLETLESAKGRPKLKSIRITTITNCIESDPKFDLFKKHIRKTYINSQEIIYAESIERFLILTNDGLLKIKDGQILNREKAQKWWRYIYENKDKLIATKLF